MVDEREMPVRAFLLSPQQRRLWSLQQDGPPFSAHCALLITGEIKSLVLREALEELLRIHEILRTAYYLRPGMSLPFQVVNQVGNLEWHEFEMRAADISRQVVEIERNYEEEGGSGRDLEHDAPMRATLVRLSPSEHLLVISLPSLCADVWTLDNLFRSIGRAYAARLQDTHNSNEVMQYVRFSEWQNELQEEGEETERGKEFWSKLRLGEIADLKLPLETASSRPPRSELDSTTLTLSTDLFAKIEAFGRELDTKPERFLLASWQILLHRLTGAPDVVVGMRSHGREYETLHESFGLFVRWVPLHCHFDGSQRFSAILRQVNESIREGAEWQDYFVLDHNNWTGGTSDAPAYFPVGFQYQTWPESYSAAGVNFLLYKADARIERFDINLSCTHKDGELSAEFQYNPDRFRRDDLQLLSERFRVLLESILDHPDTPISRLSIISAAERRRLLSAYNGASVEYSKDKCIHHLFQEQVERTPLDIAVELGEQKLTYHQLNAKANQLAHRLTRLGLGVEDPIGLLMDRSVEMMIALFGILKAGGAYVPINPAQPKGRIALMLNEANLRGVITQTELLGLLPVDYECEVVCLDSDWDSISRESEANPDSPVAPHNLSHIIFTSGSTGTPKGVAVKHGSVMSFWAGFYDAVYRDAQWSHLRVALNAPLSFDGSIKQFLLLLHGHTICVLPQEIRTDGRELVAFLKRHSLNVLDCTPTQLGLMISAGLLSPLPTDLKLVLISGEQIKEPMWRMLREAVGTTFYNVYGPTECTVDTTVYRIKRDSLAPTIGRPLANTVVYLSDSNLCLVPIGMPGELHIGGEGVARSYLNSPELTAAKFIPDPFSRKPGARLYKTGDLARHRADGNMEFLGRLDQQVKIRGFRIELEEIEAVLKEHSAVEEAIVVTREETPGDERLVAFVTASGPAPPKTNELQTFLKERLPSYMMPSAFMTLDSLPLTQSGKVNRLALPAALETKLEGGDSPKSLRGPVEEVAAEIWSKLLGVEQIDRDDSFFDLGGHSILATQLMSRLREAFQIDLPVRTIFETPSVAGLAASISAALNNEQRINIPPLVPVARGKEAPASFAQHRLWFLDRLEPGAAAFNIAVAVRLSGELETPVLHRCFNEIVRRHEVLRTTFKAIAGRPVQISHSALLLPLPIVDLDALPQEQRDSEVVRLAAEEQLKPFDLEKGPVLRTTLLRLGERQHVVFFTMHHIVSDGWSAGVLVREVAALYPAFSEGKPSPLPDLSIQYADFAHWQREWLQGEVLDNHIAYWKEQLKDSPTLALQTDRSRPATPSYKGDRLPVRLSAELTSALRALSRQEEVTIFMTLLAAFQTLLYRYTKQPEIVVGADVANRTQGETEGLIGFFVNQLVMRVSFAGNPTFKELLKRVREVSLAGYAHQDLPFDKLVQVLRPDRRSSAHPLFQVKIVFQNFPMSPLKLPGLTLSPIERPVETTTLDLILFLWDIEQALVGKLEYSTDLFNAATISRIWKQFETLLQNIIAEPAARVDDLKLLSEADVEQRMTELRKREESSRARLTIARRKSVSLNESESVKTGYLKPGQMSPLVIQPTLPLIDSSRWASDNREFIEAKLLKHGAILFRGFDIKTPPDFQSFAQSICKDLFTENGELPRNKVSDKIYTPVKYPSDKHILWHNENTFAPRWPMKIFFFCVTPSEQGGETPIVDCRKVLERIDAHIRERFLQKRILYVRNYGDGLGLPWQVVFQTDNREQVEEYCRNNSIEFEWNGGHDLKTRTVRPAIARHPKTGEMVWINQATHWHVACLDRDVRASVMNLFREEDFPRHCYFGDGSVIEDKIMDGICEAYRELEVTFTWRTGDVLLLDNMLTAHARNPYVGPREIYVTMGEMIDDKELE